MRGGTKKRIDGLVELLVFKINILHLYKNELIRYENEKKLKKGKFIVAKYSKEQEEIFIKRAKEFIKKKPEASRARIAAYSGAHIGALERLAKENNFTLPKPLTNKQQRKQSDWGSMIGRLSDK